MSQIASFIQEKIEASQAQKARLEEEARLASEELAAERKAKSLENTIKAFGYLGIEVTDADLNYDESYGYHLEHSNVRIWLEMSDGINFFNEGYKRAFTLMVSYNIPDKYRDSDGQLGHGFYWEELNLWFPIHLYNNTSEATKHVSDEDIYKIFNAIPLLQSRFQRAVGMFEQYQILKAQKNDLTFAAPRFVYEGDSREEILAAVLNDIQEAYSPVDEFGDIPY